jgi:hypothetical protein
MAREAEKKTTALKRKLEVTEQKAKDAAADLQAVVEGKLTRSPQVDFAHSVSAYFLHLDLAWM